METDGRDGTFSVCGIFPEEDVFETGGVVFVEDVLETGGVVLVEGAEFPLLLFEEDVPAHFCGCSNTFLWMF